jgi:hypothetical protein
MKPLVPGDRVEVYLTQPKGRPPYIMWRGVLVANLGNQMVILGDKSWEAGYQPISFRPDQVRPEFSGINDHAIGHAAFQIDVLTAELVRPRKWWQRKLSSVERHLIQGQICSLSLAMHTHALVDNATQQMKPVATKFTDEIILHTEDGLKPGDTVRIKIPKESGGPTTIDGKFIADFRGWRFFTYWHGGAHAYPISEVTPKKTKQRVVKLPPLVVRDLSNLK